MEKEKPTVYFDGLDFQVVAEEIVQIILEHFSEGKPWGDLSIIVNGDNDERSILDLLSNYVRPLLKKTSLWKKVRELGNLTTELVKGDGNWVITIKVVA